MIVADNILELLDAFGEERIRKMLVRFRCVRNPNVEHFLRSNAVDFSKQGLSVTYVVTRPSGDTGAELLGFFALTYKILRLGGGSLSRTSEKRIAKFAEHDAAANTYTLAAPLIAQIGKNDLPPDAAPFAGRELMALAEDKLRAVMRQIGGRAAYLECEEEPKLMAFYESLGFVRAAKRYDKSKADGADRLYHIYVKFLNPAGRPAEAA